MKIIWFCCKNKLVSSVLYLKLLITLPWLRNTIMHNALDTYTLCGPLKKAWRARVQDSGVQTHEFLLFSFSLRLVFSFFYPQKANKCYPFIIIYYFARYSCIACIMLLKPIGQRKYKQKFTTQGSKEGRKEWPTDRPSEWIAFCKNSHKKDHRASGPWRAVGRWAFGPPGRWDVAGRRPALGAFSKAPHQQCSSLFFTFTTLGNT